MVLKKLVSFIYSLIGLRGPPRIKGATSCKTIVVDVPDSAKADGALDFPDGSSSCENLEVEGEMCCVCLSRLKIEEDMSVLPCTHKFHKACVDRWFISVCQKTCPLCRLSVGAEKMCYAKERFTEEMVIWFSSFHVAGF